MENWKDIIGYEGFYQISNQGSVKSLERKLWNGKILFTAKERILKFNINNSGYKYVNLHKSNQRQTTTIHRLVAIAFLNHIPDKTNKVVIDHIDGDKLNNNDWNLRLTTNRANLSKYKNRSSKYTGVHFHKTNLSWQANIWHNGKKKYLGSFSNEDDAGTAYINYLNKISV